MDQIHGEVDAQIDRGLPAVVVASSRVVAPPLPRVAYRWSEKKRVKPVRSEKPQPAKGEMRLIDFIHAEMDRTKRSRPVIYERLVNGYYKGVTVRRVNGRNMFVAVRRLPRLKPETPLPGELWMKDFAFQEAQRTGVGIPAIYMRLRRGGYPNVKIRMVNRRVAFVMVKESFATENAENL